MATSSPPSMDGMSPVYELKIRQQPKNARVAIGKEKDRKPIDPPPIIQLDIHPMRHQIHNPYLILVCRLVAPGSTENDEANHQQPEPKDNDLTGSLCSSPYVLKDTNNAQGLFFIFQDVSVRREGTYRLEFNLFELKPLTRECIALARTTSDKFVVFPHRYFPGMAESTFLTRSFSDQGVRIRLRKDSRSVSTRKRGVSALGVGAGSGGVVGRLRTGSTIGLGGQQYSPITISHHSQSHGSGGSHDELSPTSTSPIHRINTTLAGHHHHDLIPGIGHLDRGQHHRGSLASQASSSLLDSPSNTMLTSPTVTGVGGFGASTATTMGGSGNYSFTGVAAAQQYSYPGTALGLTTGITADDRYYDYNRAGKRPRLLHGTGVDDPLDHSYGRDPYGRDPYDHHHRGVVGSVTLPPHTQGYATMDAAHGYGHGRHHDYYGATATGAYFGSGM